jgi:hypothetical protein
VGNAAALSTFPQARRGAELGGALDRAIVLEPAFVVISADMTERSDQRCEKRRLNPLGGETLGTAWTSLRLAHPLTGEQKQKKRTCDVLLKPDNLIRYRHFSCICLQKIRNVVIVSARVDIVSEAAPRRGRVRRGRTGGKMDVGRKSRRNPLKSHKTRKKTADHLGLGGGD